MKKIQFILLIVLLIGLPLKGLAQQTEKEKERQERKVQIFTPEESDNFQLWFYNETKKMNLPEVIEDEYYRIILHYTYDMRRLNDTDKSYTSEEMKTEFEKIVQTLNGEVKKVLNCENYKKHVENFDKTLQAVYNRVGWTWDKE